MQSVKARMSETSQHTVDAMRKHYAVTLLRGDQEKDKVDRRCTGPLWSSWVETEERAGRGGFLLLGEEGW